MDIIRIAIVEDDIDWLKKMITILNIEKEFVIIGAAMNKNEAILLAKSVDIDIILMGFGLSSNKSDIIQAIAEISSLSKAKIIMLSSLEEPELIIDSFTFGAVCFFCKDHFQNITQLIKEISIRKTPYEILLQDYKRLKRKEHLEVLTETELETFTLLEQGFTHREIASKLVKSQDTVKIQVTSILKKLNVHSVKEAIKKVNLKLYQPSL